MGYAMTTTVKRPFTDALGAIRHALADQGFGILTEIDMQATLQEKIGAAIPPQVILGACRPPLALAALEAEPSIGLLLPCNIVVRALDDTRTVVEAMDPATMVRLTENDRLSGVADDARARLSAALDSLSGQPD
jgi:uncharacterized protein (DUF302 family)